MELSNQEKDNLKRCLKSANNFVILTTGRAGSDFLQSCYDNHEEVASTSEKSINLSFFINKNKELLPKSNEVFSALSISELLFSFAPYVNHIENWDITKESKYKKANITRYLEAMNFLLDLEEIDKTYLNIARIIIISFSYSINKRIDLIKTVLIHLHHINQLSYYEAELDHKDLVVVCSRSPFDLVASGVFHWRKYWFNTKQYCNLIKLTQYRNVMRRTLFDFVDIKKYSYPKNKISILILEKLSNLDYLNRINNFLSIKIFQNYPASTVLGQAWGGDFLSKSKTSIPTGGYNSNLVKRGSPSSRLGIIDSSLITLLCKERLEFYKISTGENFLNSIIKINFFSRIFFFFILLTLPTRIELIYIFDILKILGYIIFCKSLSQSEKIKQLLASIFYILSLPIEYLRIRIFKIKAFYMHLKCPNFISELN